jgi:glycerol-3-phosphate dehydrogenase
MQRQQVWSRLATSPLVDLVVVGGGATGLGVALDATLRGHSVVLLESHDFGSGTSSRSTKLLHGGVRYLAQGHLPLVREALRERTTVLHLAPHLAQPLPFVMPSYQWWQTPFYGLGLKAYDLLAGRARLGPTRWLDAAQTQTLLPGVQPAGLQGGVLYWDAQFEDARLALALARTAAQAGAVLANHAEVTHIQPASPAASDGARFTVEVTDRLQGQAARLRTRAVVNATGVWVDRLRQPHAAAASGPAPARLVSPSQGVHLVVERDFLPGDHALLVPKTADGRVLFAVPWLGSLLLGTTDTPRPDVTRDPEPFEHELDFILTEASRVLQRPVRRHDIRSQWVGLRPLVAAQAGRGTGGPSQSQSQSQSQSMSREHTIVVDASGLLTVTGGKWTTYRAMAEDVLRTCAAHRLLPERAGAGTARHRLLGAPDLGLPGSPNPPGPLGKGAVSLAQPPGPHLYGTEWPKVQACPGASVELGMGLTEAMVRFAARHEYACTVQDVLARRWRVLFLDAALARQMAPQVADILQQETGLDPQQQVFAALSERYLPH